MSTNQLFFLIATLPVLLVGVLAVVGAIGWRSWKSTGIFRTATDEAARRTVREETE